MHAVASLVLGIVLALAAPAAVALAETYAHGYLRYEVSDQSVTIVGYEGLEEKVTIPAMIGGNPVNTIAEGSFVNAKTVKLIILPDTVSTVEEGAFAADQQVIYGEGSVGVVVGPGGENDQKRGTEVEFDLTDPEEPEEPTDDPEEPENTDDPEQTDDPEPTDNPEPTDDPQPTDNPTPTDDPKTPTEEGGKQGGKTSTPGSTTNKGQTTTPSRSALARTGDNAIDLSTVLLVCGVGAGLALAGLYLRRRSSKS